MIKKNGNLCERMTLFYFSLTFFMTTCTFLMCPIPKMHFVPLPLSTLPLQGLREKKNNKHTALQKRNTNTSQKLTEKEIIIKEQFILMIIWVMTMIFFINLYVKKRRKIISLTT